MASNSAALEPRAWCRRNRLDQTRQEFGRSAHQYCGAVGKQANCQVSVELVVSDGFVSKGKYRVDQDPNTRNKPTPTSTPRNPEGHFYPLEIWGLSAYSSLMTRDFHRSPGKMISATVVPGVDALPRLKPMGFGGDNGTCPQRGLTGVSRPETATRL